MPTFQVPHNTRSGLGTADCGIAAAEQRVHMVTAPTSPPIFFAFWTANLGACTNMCHAQVVLLCCCVGRSVKLCCNYKQHGMRSTIVLYDLRRSCQGGALGSRGWVWGLWFRTDGCPWWFLTQHGPGVPACDKRISSCPSCPAALLFDSELQTHLVLHLSSRS